MTLFTLIGLTFVLATSQGSLGAKAASRANRTGTSPRLLHRRVLQQIIRGHQNPVRNASHDEWSGSVIGPHSLLEDMYGDDNIAAMIPPEMPSTSFGGFRANEPYSDSNGNGIYDTGEPYQDLNGNNTWDSGDARFCMGQGSMLYIEIPDINNVPTAGGGVIQMSQTVGYYNGRVITMVDGPARGHSSRITGYQVDLTATPVRARLRLLPFDGMTTNQAGTIWEGHGAPRVDNTFLINGRAFSGSGFGFNPDTGANGTTAFGLLNLADPTPVTGGPFALLPNPTSPIYRSYMRGGIVIGSTVAMPGANEDYDAPDYQNMLLAGQRVSSGLDGSPGVAGVDDDNDGTVDNNSELLAPGSDDRWFVWVPSLHRPALINYWSAPLGGWGSVPPDLKRKFSLRPLPDDHFKDVNNSGGLDAGEPFFTGSNPNYDPINGPWDVDNDGDGLPDSIWVDLGFPVQTAPDGRKYKPLFAILCLDLDNRLNLNVHGKPSDYRTVSAGDEYVATDHTPPLFRGPYARAYNDANANGQYDPGEEVAVQLPIGSGYGVADVNLAVALSNTPATLNEYRQLLEGRPPGAPIGWAIPGRYGEEHLLYAGSGIIPRPGVTSTGSLIHGGWFPGSAFDDCFDGDDNRPLGVMGIIAGGNAQAAYYGNLYQDGYFPGIAMGANGSPPGLAGNGTVALDWRGQPFWWNSGYIGTPDTPATGAFQESVDDAYELDVTLGDQRRSDPATGGDTLSVDTPFSAAELDRVLRIHDADALALPGRLGMLAPSLADPFNGNARLVTTDSWDPPSPNVVATRDMVIGEDVQEDSASGGFNDFVNRVGIQPTNLHITDLLHYRLAQWGVAPADWNREAANLLSPDLVAGLRMDINRPFGDGLDNNNNNVVDEVLETLSGAERLWRDPGADGTFGTMDDGPDFPFDANADGLPPIDANDSLARYELAKHIYVLLMLFKDYHYNHPTPVESGLSTAERQELTSRKLAQWAINAVDFRDRDSICTPFEYDPNPFNGWDVDGFLGPHPVTGIDDSTTLLPSQRGVVWGCEYPDLALSETKAVHDRRSEDLDDYEKTAMGTPPGMDPHFDQRRIPQGSAFFEIYNTRNPHNPALPGDLYTPSGHLDLGRMDNNNTGTYPIWRLVIGERNDTPGTLADVATLLDTRDETLGLDVDDMDMLAPGPQAVEVDRIVWFGAGPPAAAVIDANKIYYNVHSTASNVYGGNSDVLLGPGQYAVVGPHRRPESGDDNITTIGYTAVAPYAQEIRLGNAPATTGAGGRRSVIVSDVDGTATTYPDDPVTAAAAGSPGTYEIQEPLGIAVAGNPTGTANAIWAGQHIGFSVSEPLFSAGPLDPNPYYPLPNDPAPTPITHYDGSPSTWLDKYTPTLDEPLDNTLNLELIGLPETGTALNYKTVFLQRLADPTRPFDVVNNPYLTVDWMPIDLTVFNGEEAAAYPDPSLIPPDADIRFGTRQRGSPRDPAAAPDPKYYYNIWKQPDWLDQVNWPPIVTATQTTNFGYQLDHTLGYLNLPFHDATVPAGSPAWLTTDNVPIGEPYIDSNGNNAYDAGEPYWDANSNAAYDAGNQLVQYVGDPLRPFPWLTWLNRPLASNMELLLVPHTSSGRLLHEFDMRLPPTASLTDDDHYGDTDWTTPAPFGHLLNFFHSVSADPKPPTSATPQAWSGNYYRILEYVHVPSRFSGTQELLNPTIFQAGSASLAPGEGSPFYAPFNRVSRYRDPGRININTIFDNGRTWQGILNRLQESTVVDPAWTSGGFWSKVVRSRRGYGTSGNLDEFNPDSPTFLANPFRSFGQGYAVPIEPLRRVGLSTNPSAPFRGQVESTLMRPDPDTVTPPLQPSAGPQEPLFGLHTTANTATVSDYIDTDRNPYFRYQAYQKLGNVFTTRSNVYAIWITVGYFEVERGPIDLVHPDGYRLGQEMGIDTGDIKRDRAFYIYDRSIPVGFRRGENLNVEKGILVERVIE
ncbi:MAG: hypothetical protein WD847_02990 [Pirellulales bacterium]